MLGRTMHAIAYDEIHDEFVVPQPFSQAILTFRGSADGEEPPIRFIQGPRTELKNQTDQVAIDPVNNEIYVPQEDRILVFPREANGNVAPIRVLAGPDTLLGAETAAVDPVHDLLIVTGWDPASQGGGGGISIFNRTDQGNVRPKARIVGSNVNLARGNSRVYLHPPGGWILVVATEPRGSAASGGSDTNRGFVGVWNIEDDGNVPPRWMIGGPGGVLQAIRGAALIPKHKSVMISDKRQNAVFTFYFPEIF